MLSLLHFVNGSALEDIADGLQQRANLRVTTDFSEYARSLPIPWVHYNSPLYGEILCYWSSLQNMGYLPMELCVCLLHLQENFSEPQLIRDWLSPSIGLACSLLFMVVDNYCSGVIGFTVLDWKKSNAVDII